MPKYYAAPRCGKQSQATRLVGLAGEAGAALWHDADSGCWATIPVGGHREHWPLGSGHFRRWLAQQMHQADGKTPGGQALQDAINTLGGQALFDGPEYPIFTRLAEHQGNIYLDLGGPEWQAVEVTATGWGIV